VRVQRKVRGGAKKRAATQRARRAGRDCTRRTARRKSACRSPHCPRGDARAGDAAEQLLSCRWCAGPFLNFLALHEQRKLENSDKLESLKITFWPFAVAGGFL
jgi:hypothetical protein